MEQNSENVVLEIDDKESRNEYFQSTEKRFLSLKDLVNLIVKPSEFFRTNLCLNRVLICFIMLIIGIRNVILRIDDKVTDIQTGIKISDEVLTSVIYNWVFFWFYVIFMGILSGLALWWISGWWYNLRLKWCLLEPFEKDHGRAICFYNRLIFSMPAVSMIVVSTFLVNNYYEYYQNKSITLGIFNILIVLLMILSVINSYRSIRTIFKIKKLLTLIWFLILPLVFYTVVITVMIVAIMYNLI